jgi:hypothetical protein
MVEEVVTLAENPPAENNFYFNIYGVDQEPPATQSKPPVHLPLSLLF